MSEKLTASTPESLDRAANNINNASVLAELAGNGGPMADFGNMAPHLIAEETDTGSEQVSVLNYGEYGPYRRRFDIGVTNIRHDEEGNPVQAVRYGTNIYPYNSREGTPGETLKDGGYDLPVSVVRQAKVDGKTVDTTVITQLTGERAKRAREIITNRAARKLGRATLEILRFE